MATIQIANVAKAVAVGLEWHALSGTTSERKEIEALAAANNSKIGCVITDDETGVTVVGLGHDKRPGASCGAAWLAKASGREALILVEPVGDNQVWICAVRAGLPLQNADQVVEVARLHELIHACLADSPDARICSTLENLDASYANVSPQSFAELVTGIKPERLRRVSGVPPLAVAGVVVAVAAIGAYYGGTLYLQKVERDKFQALLAAQAKKSRSSEQAQLRALEQKRRDDAERLLRDVVLGQPGASTLIPAAFASFESVPLSAGSWALVSLDCVPASCLLSWKREKNGTVMTFLAAAEKAGWEVVGAAGSEALTKHPVDTHGRDATTDVIEPTAAFRAVLESQLQRAQFAGMSYRLEGSQPLDVPVAAPAQPGAPGASPQSLEPLPWKVGRAVIEGKHLFELRALPAYLEHGALAVSSIKANLQLKEWTVEVKYATR